jgi:hypothetical protein
MRCDARRVAARDFAAQHNLMQQMGGLQRQLRTDAPRSSAAHIVVDPREQAVELEEGSHETNLVETNVQKEPAELAQRNLRSSAPSVIVTLTFGVGVRQGVQVPRPLSGESARCGPQAVPPKPRASQIGIGVQARHATIAIQKRMDPQQAMMARGNGDDGVQPPQPCRIVAFGESAEEPGYRTRRRRNMAADLRLVLTPLAGSDQPLFPSVGAADDAPLARHPLVELAMQGPEKVWRRDLKG